MDNVCAVFAVDEKGRFWAISQESVYDEMYIVECLSLDELPEVGRIEFPGCSISFDITDDTYSHYPKIMLLSVMENLPLIDSKKDEIESIDKSGPEDDVVEISLINKAENDRRFITVSLS